MIMFFKPEKYVLSYCNFIWTNICEKGGYISEFRWKDILLISKSAIQVVKSFELFSYPKYWKLEEYATYQCEHFFCQSTIKHDFIVLYYTLELFFTLVFISKFDFIISGIQVLKGQVKGQLSQPIAQFVKWRPMATCKATMGVNPHVSVAEPSFEGRIRKPATPSFSARVLAIVRLLQPPEGDARNAEWNFAWKLAWNLNLFWLMTRLRIDSSKYLIS